MVKDKNINKYGYIGTWILKLQNMNIGSAH